MEWNCQMFSRMEAKIIRTDKYVIDNSSYLSFDARLRSFEGEWTSDKFPKSEQLAQCGFYLGSTGSNRTWCFYCGRYKFKDEWTAFDNPWVEHAVIAPECPFFLLNRSTQAAFNWNNPEFKDSPSRFQNIRVSYCILS